MVNINTLVSLSEGAVGYVGGSYTDMLPDMSLDEAVNSLPTVIVESQYEFITARRANNDALLEAAVIGAATGTAPDYESIVEASFEDIKKKIKAFFDKIIKFLKSIVAKLTLQIDKMRMTGHQLYTKYKDSKMLQGKDWKDLTFNGYKFEKADIFAGASKYEADIEALIKAGAPNAALPKDFKADWDHEVKSGSKGKTGESGARKKIDALTDRSTADRQLGMAKTLTGESGLSQSWESDLKTKLYGEKIDIKYGQHMFKLDTLGSMLEKPAELESIKNEYAKIEQAAHTYHDNLERDVNDMESEISSLNSADGDNSAAVNGKSLVVSYFNAYMGLVSDSYAVINKVKNIKYNYQKARYDQAKSMFAKMLSYKGAKSNNNDASEADDDVLLLDFDL